MSKELASGRSPRRGAPDPAATQRRSPPSLHPSSVPGPARTPSTSSPAISKNSSTSLLTRTISDFSLSSHVILVTGAARGLGLTQAEALLESGATVYALDRLPNPSGAFNRIQERARTELGTALHYRQIDVQDTAALNQIVESIANKEGRLDGLIAAAGIQQETPALEYTAEDANRMFAVNLTGVLMTAQAVARQIIRLDSQSQPTQPRKKKQKGGSIVLIASMSGTVANRGLACPAYNASKAGILQLTRNLASEWGQHSIRINSISPGYILTEMVLELFERFPERREKWAGENMLGRLSRPEEYKGAAVFLLSGASGFMTGADLRIDGGHAAW